MEKSICSICIISSMLRFILEHCTKRMALVFCSLSPLFMGTNPLVLKEFVTPPKLVVGSTVTLSCVLDLGGDVLQSIKWYKDDTEFCSYGAFGGGQQTTHRLMNVKELKCGNMSLRFGPISATATGTYKCEASSVAQFTKSAKPSVQTVMGSRNLSVFAYPMDAPIISGLKTHYHAGEFIEAQCTSPPSYPAPEMSWSINGKSVDGFKTNIKVHEDRGLLRATLSVKLMADAGLFKNPGAYALFVCTSILMDTPAMTAEAKVYWSTEPASTESNAKLKSHDDVFRNSLENGNRALKDEPPDAVVQGTDTHNYPDEDENVRKVGPDAEANPRASRGFLSGSRKGIPLVSICLAAISLVCTFRKFILFLT